MLSICFKLSNVLGLEAISEILHKTKSDFPPAECILGALKLCIECNNSAFNYDFYLQVDGTAMDPYTSCSYSDITIYKFDVKALNYKTCLFCWKRYRDDVFVLWNQSLEELNSLIL